MTILVASVLLCTAAGCADPTDPVPAPPDLTITTTGECARISFQITGSSSVTTWYPSAGCTVGLVVIRSAGASTWNGSTRTLTLKLRVANTSTEPVTLPVRLELPVEGKTVTLPEGVSPDSLVPLDMDSTLAADRKLWLVGGTGTLAPGDSSETRTLTFQVREPVTKGRFWFVSSGEEIPTVPAVAPDSMPGWLGSDSAFAGGIAKNALLVEFDSTATVAEKAAAIDSVNGVVVGGTQFSGDTDGPYVLWVPAPNLDSLFAAIDILERQPKVVSANVIARARDFGRRPSDHASWGPPSWTFLPDSGNGGNWWLEEIAAPLAWGCTVGDPATAVAVVDHGFVSDDFAPNLVNALPDSSPSNHGRLVTNVLAARGNNGVGMAGVMWFAKLRLYDRVRQDTLQSQVELAQAIDKAIQDGARVVQVSSGASFYADTVQQRKAARAYRDRLAALLRRWVRRGNPLPLLVIAAGNERQPSDLAGSPWLVDTYPGNVLVVGASTRPVSGVRHRWGYQGTGRGDSAGSNYGPRVEIFAPGEGVDVWQATDAGGFSTGFVTWEGTSFAAPAVAGIAGLLWSLDSTLTAQEVKQLIIDGAQQGNRPVLEEPNRFVANAYESLKLLARQRTGVPLCGNRVFADSTNRIFAERQSGDELLYANSQNRIGLLRPYHGGRRLRLFDYAVGDQDLTWAGGSWSIGAPAANPPEPPSGTWFSLDGLTHDGDSLAYTYDQNGFTTLTGGSHTVNVSLGTITTFPGRLLGTTTSITLAGATTYTPTRQGFDTATGSWRTTDSTPTDLREQAIPRAYPSPLEDAVFLVIDQWSVTLDSLSAWTSCGAACQFRDPYYRVRSQKATVYRVPRGLNAGTIPPPLWTVSDSSIRWLGIAEDGSEVVAAIARDDTVGDNASLSLPAAACYLSYRDASNGAPRRAIRKTTACEGGATRGDGGLSPIIARDARPGVDPPTERTRAPGWRVLDFLRPTARRSP